MRDDIAARRHRGGTVRRRGATLVAVEQPTSSSGLASTARGLAAGAEWVTRYAGVADDGAPPYDPASGPSRGRHRTAEH